MLKYLTKSTHAFKLRRRRVRAYLKYFLHRPRVLARMACLGDNVQQKLNLSDSIINHQKSRVDHLIHISKKQPSNMRLSKIVKHLARLDIAPLLFTQKYNLFKYYRPDIFIMDSFSELTDQCFMHRHEKWKFYAHYSDVCQSEDFKTEFECLGLLHVDEIHSYYDDFFRKFNKVYPNVPILFIHFPTSLDSREMFKHRAQVIKESLNRLTCDNDTLFSFSVDEAIVEREPNCSEELKDFPYHYNDKTYTTLAQNIRDVIVTHKLLPHKLLIKKEK